MTFTVYGLKDDDGVIRYIGSTSLSAERRRNKHAQNSFIEQRSNRVCVWIRELGHAPEVVILAEVSAKEEALRLEELLIQESETHVHGFNSTPTGGPRGYKHTEEARKIMREHAHTERHVEQRARLHAYNKERDYGEEFGRTVSAATKGVPKSEAHRRALSEVNRGKKMPAGVQNAMQEGIKRFREQDPEKWHKIRSKAVNIVAKCDECGYTAVVQTVGRHKKKTGHAGHTVIARPE